LAIRDKPFDNEQRFGTIETDLKLMREILNQERQKRDVFMQDVLQQYKDVCSNMNRNESGLLDKMRKNKEELFEENKRSKEQQKKLEELKLEKILGDSEYLRSLIRQVDTKISDEVNKRLKHEFENKTWFEQKMTLFRQEIKAEEKEILENEKKFLGNIQESMNSLNQIMANTKQHLEADLVATQTLFNENVKSK